MNSIGFCSKCGLVRQDDANGDPETDCVCTAKTKHLASCTYLLSVSCPIDVGIYCKAHLLTACEECDCDCGAISREHR